MGGLRISLAAALLPVALLLSGSGFPQDIVSLEIEEVKGREVLILRTSGDVPAPGAYSSDADNASISFSLRMVGIGDVSLPPGGKLIRAVELDGSAATGVRVSLKLASAELTKADNLRISQPGVRLILVEVFGSETSKQQSAPILDPEELFGPGEPPAPAAALQQHSISTAAASALDELLSLDLRESEPGRVLSLAAEHGLLDISGTARINTAGWGEVKMFPAGLSLSGWADSSGPGELYLSGSSAQIAAFLKDARPESIARQPRFDDYWASNMPRPRGSSGSSGGLAMGGKNTSSALSDGTAGLANSSGKLPGGGSLSDIRVTLPAGAGANLFDVLNHLSRISGISLIVDPYVFDEPFGSPRSPLPPAPPPGMADQPGFRGADVFDPQITGGGTVMGNLEDVPFDMALSLILGVHELEYVVYSGGDTRSGNFGRADEPYTKPVILVTSRERLEQELAGTSEINLYQMHYADPDQVTPLLDNFSLLPGSQSGWYVYRGGGNGGGGNAGGGNGGGGALGSGSGGRSAARRSAAPDLLAWRGGAPDAVHAEVERAIADGDSVIRVLLSGDERSEAVTIFSR